jgi:hypothetical protein
VLPLDVLLQPAVCANQRRVRVNAKHFIDDVLPDEISKNAMLVARPGTLMERDASIETFV